MGLTSREDCPLIGAVNPLGIYHHIVDIQSARFAGGVVLVNAYVQLIKAARAGPNIIQWVACTACHAT